MAAAETDAAPAAEPSHLNWKQLAGIVAGIVLFANVAFYFLSERYFIERAAKHGAGELAHLAGVRLYFTIFSSSVGAAAIAATASPFWVGHALGALAGPVALAGAIAALRTDIPMVLGTSLLTLGVLMPVVAVRSKQGSRAAWAFLVALTGVLAMITMFGAPTIGRKLGISMWLAMILPGLLAVGAAALTRLSDRYRDS